VQIRREAERERMNRGRGGRIEEAGDEGGGREDDGDEDEDGGAPLPSRSGSGGPRGRFPLPRHPLPLPRRARVVAALSLADPTRGAPPRPIPVTSAAGRLLLQPRPASSTISTSSTACCRPSHCIRLRRRGPARATAPGCAGANCPSGMRLPLETIPPFLLSLAASCSFLKIQIGVLLETVLPFCPEMFTAIHYFLSYPIK
jgi:hypothetical protein